MAKVLQGNRIAKQGNIAAGCSAVIFDTTREHILLIKRADSGRWAVLGGGEDLAETYAREVLEETRQLEMNNLDRLRVEDSFLNQE